jgi:DNA-binding MarR family transcriptional regulator
VATAAKTGASRGSASDRSVSTVLEADSLAVDFGPMEHHIGFLLRLAQIEDFKRFYQRFGDRELRPGEYSALIAIGINPGIRQGVLANALMIKRSNMAKMIGVLTRRGLVRRRVPAGDKRAVELYPTTKSRSLIGTLMPEITEHDMNSSSMLEQAERELLIGLLKKVIGRSGNRRRVKDPASR